MSYIALDCEMGGIDLKYSLLQAYFLALNDDLSPISELDLRLKPDDGDYIVNAEALSVNKIDLVKHDSVAITYSEGRSKLGDWLRRLYDSKKVKFLALGHNVSGDVRFIWHHLYGRKKWENYVSYRQLDTATICQFLKDGGKLPKAIDGPEGVSGSLSSLVKYLGIPSEETARHEAKTDTLLTIEVYKRLLKL